MEGPPRGCIQILYISLLRLIQGEHTEDLHNSYTIIIEYLFFPHIFRVVLYIHHAGFTRIDVRLIE